MLAWYLAALTVVLGFVWLDQEGAKEVCTYKAVTGPLPSVPFLGPGSLAPQMVTVWNCELLCMACCE